MITTRWGVAYLVVISAVTPHHRRPGHSAVHPAHRALGPRSQRVRPRSSGSQSIACDCSSERDRDAEQDPADHVGGRVVAGEHEATSDDGQWQDRRNSIVEPQAAVMQAQQEQAAEAERGHYGHGAGRIRVLADEGGAVPSECLFQHVLRKQPGAKGGYDRERRDQQRPPSPPGQPGIGARDQRDDDARAGNVEDIVRPRQCPRVVRPPREEPHVEAVARVRVDQGAEDAEQHHRAQGPDHPRRTLRRSCEEPLRGPGIRTAMRNVPGARGHRSPISRLARAPDCGTVRALKVRAGAVEGAPGNPMRARME